MRRLLHVASLGFVIALLFSGESLRAQYRFDHWTADDRELRPEVAVLDINMPSLKGFDVAREVRREGSPTQIIFLTMYDDERMFNEALNAGALGYLLKDSAISDIVESIRTVAGGRHFITPAISGYLIKRSARSQSLQDNAAGLKDLTPAEMRILVPAVRRRRW